VWSSRSAWPRTCARRADRPGFPDNQPHMVRLPAFDIYLELGLAPTADRAEIRAAYRHAAKEAHPDVSDTAGSTARMARINAARDVLLDQDRRAEYDRQHGLLARSPTRTPRTAGAPTGARRRGRPATDQGPATDVDDDVADGRAATRGRRGPPIAECPVCAWPDPAPFGHCALGHEDMAPRFGGPRRFRLDPIEHGSGMPFGSAREARDHARACSWFAATRAGGGRPIVLAGWGGRAEFPAVGRIRQRDGVALDPEVVAVLAAYADEAAVRDALAYAVAGRVVLMTRHGDRVRSIVCGRHAYAVELTVGASGSGAPSRASCSCPSWRPSCKHVLATWLVWHYTRPS